MTTMARPTQPPPPRGPLDPDALDALLARLEDEHGVLLELAKQHRDALTHADVEALQQITMRTSETLMRIAGIEQERQDLIARRAGAVDTLDELLQRFDNDDRARLDRRRKRLRELIERVRDEQEAVRIASERLALHMKGLMKQVGASLSHAGTYSRAGSVEAGRTQIVSGLDTVT